MNTLYIISASVILLVILSYFRNKKAKSKIVRVITDNCTGCKRCLKICRHKALEIVIEEDVAHVVLKNPQKCTACEKCVALCKFNALEIVERESGG